jgi:hypothetical protein
LVSEDVDTALDVYDAHVCSVGVPCVARVVSSPACVTADACRVAPSAQPEVFGSPASATFSGRGNVVPVAVSAPAVKKVVKCKRGFVKGKKGKCVKKKAKRAVRARRARSDRGAG